MLNDEFNKVVSDRLKKIADKLTAKADEYARGDRLSNFKRAGAMLQQTPEKALAGLVSKHIIATLDFIDDIDRGVLQPMPRWDEKIGDIMAYMVLLEALIIERQAK